MVVVPPALSWAYPHPSAATVDSTTLHPWGLLARELTCRDSMSETLIAEAYISFLGTHEHVLICRSWQCWKYVVLYLIVSFALQSTLLGTKPS